MPIDKRLKGLFCCAYLLRECDLTEQELKYIYLRFWHQMSYREIAEFDERGMSKQGVDYIIKKAYKKIKNNFTLRFDYICYTLRKELRFKQMLRPTY